MESAAQETPVLELGEKTKRQINPSKKLTFRELGLEN